MTRADRPNPDPQRSAATGDEFEREGFWEGFLLGLERSSQSSYDAGYADADRNLQHVITCFLRANPIREVIRQMDTHVAREAARSRPVDQRSGPELIRDTYVSWGLQPPAPAATDPTTDDGLDDAAGY